jgi:predicted transcriptional regulator
MTENVAKHLFTYYPAEANRLYKAENLKLFILNKPVVIPLVIVLDSILVFKLSESDGKFRDQLVLSSGKEATDWGIELFEFCMEQAEPLNKEKLIFRL